MGVVGPLLGIVLVGYVAIVLVAPLRYWFNRQDGYKTFFATLLAGSVAASIGSLAAKATTVCGVEYAWAWHAELCQCVSWAMSDLRQETASQVLMVVWGCSVDVAVSLAAWAGVGFRNKVYAKFVAKRSGDLIECVLQDALDRKFTVELTMENGKTYVGRPTESGVATSPHSDVALVPMASGYRTTEKEIQLTTFYEQALTTFASGDGRLRETDFVVFLPKSQIQSARHFDHAVYLASFRRSGGSVPPSGATLAPPA